jgi:hypothetical protein
LYDFLTSKAVKCFVCFEESDQKAINPNSTALGVTLFGGGSTKSETDVVAAVLH